MDRTYEDGDWVIEKGKDGYFSISFFNDGHYYSEIIIKVKDGDIEVVRHD